MGLAISWLQVTLIQVIRWSTCRAARVVECGAPTQPDGSLHLSGTQQCCRRQSAWSSTAITPLPTAAQKWGKGARESVQVAVCGANASSGFINFPSCCCDGGANRFHTTSSADGPGSPALACRGATPWTKTASPVAAAVFAVCSSESSIIPDEESTASCRCSALSTDMRA